MKKLIDVITVLALLVSLSACAGTTAEAEYTLADGAAYPADDTDIVITGAFELYEELGVEYCRLGNAKVET